MWLTDEPDEVLWEITHPDFEEDGDYTTLVNPTQFHEFIKSRQRKSSAATLNKKPSKNTEVYWIYANNNKKSYPNPTDRSGKWLIFCPPQDIDDAWCQIKYGIETGLLGACAKVSTKKGFGFRGYSSHVICVYTYDWKDYDDVMKIRNELRELGFDKPLSYKSDEDTLKRKYAENGCRGLAKYYE